MRRYSACIEWLFADSHPEFVDRIGAAKAAGLDAVEFWKFSTRDVGAIKAALDASGMSLAGILCEPIANLTDPATHEGFLAGVVSSMAAAQTLGAEVIIAQAGNALPDVPRADQHAAIAAVLKRAAEILAGSGVVLALEPLNDRVDHPGYYLTSTVEGLDIVDAVGRAEVRLLYDIYHSAMMDERTETVLAGRIDRVVHVHLADAPGRNQPDNGTIDWRERIAWLESQGYAGRIGLEYRPIGTTSASLSFR